MSPDTSTSSSVASVSGITCDVNSSRTSVRVGDILPHVEFDLTEANRFLAAVHADGTGQGHVNLLLKLRDGGCLKDASAAAPELLAARVNTLWLGPNEVQLPETEAELGAALAGYWNVYTSVCRFRGVKRASDEATWLPGTWADLDVKLGVENGFTSGEQLDEFATSLAPPSVLVDTGSGGRHPYWLLDEGISDPAKMTALLDRWRSLVLVRGKEVGKHVDLAVFDRARILRLPGTVRQPKLQVGEAVTSRRQVRLLFSDGPRYTLEQLTELTAGAHRFVQRARRQHRRAVADDEQRRIDTLVSRGLDRVVYHDVVRVFEQVQDWAPMLLATGWTADADNREGTGTTAARYWIRPGKTEGGSADTDFGQSTVMYVFSTDPSLDDLFLRPRDGVNNIVTKFRYALVRLYGGDEAKLIKDIIAGGGRVL